jgi:hypothetical protein
MPQQIATENCKGRLELFKHLLEMICQACALSLNLTDIDGHIAVRDGAADSEIDPDWPCVATFKGTTDPAIDGQATLIDWEICTKPTEAEALVKRVFDNLRRSGNE